MEEMIKIVLMCFIAHHLGDYYLQNGILATKKADSYFYTVIHCFLYGIPFLFLWFFLLKKDLFLFRYICMIGIFHVPVDLCKCYLTKNKDSLVKKGYKAVGKTTLIYFLDQMIHLVTIVVILMRFYAYPSMMNYPLLEWFSIHTISFFLYFIVGFQVYYVGIRKLTKKENGISNWYSRKDFGLKTISATICLLMALMTFTSIILVIMYGVITLLKKRMDKEVYQYMSYSIMITFGLSLIRYVVYFII